MWEEHLELSKPEAMRESLLQIFSANETDKIMEAANTTPVKEKLLATTDRAIKSGAYGAPWFEVTNNKGQIEPFFGSDRFHHMWEFLNLPWKDIELVERSKM